MTHGATPAIAQAAIQSFNQAIEAQPAKVVAMDDASGGAVSFKLGLSALPDELVGWYASQRFIGYQTCATVAQHWLVDKACTMPARDAIRHGFDIQAYGEETPLTDEQPADISEKIKRADRRYKLPANMREFVRMGRIFGVRVAFFKIKGATPEYYENPFNPDGITPGSYQGIVQVDPYWCVPLLSAEAASDPSSMHFYEPEWWLINGRKYHRSHLCIFRTGELPDVLKPMYNYGGVSVPQRILERVYAAERTANEGPQLAQSKRLTVPNTDPGEAYANRGKFLEHMQQWAYYRDNFGIKVADTDDTIQQFDTALGDLDTVIMTQYQLVAAAAGVPATKLLGTTPKGFNATGEYEAESYHEELETIQANDLTEFVNRHHILVMRSEIEPDMGISPGSIRIEIDWAPVDSPTAKEYAEISRLNAETDNILQLTGAIDAMDIRNRLRSDPNSNYTDLEKLEAPDVDDEEGDDLGDPGAQDPVDPDA